MTKNVTVTWDIDLTRTDGTVLPTSEIEKTVVSMKVDDPAASWTEVGTVLQGEPQAVTVGLVAIGDWLFRLVVTDTTGKPSAPQNFPFSVASDANPSGVLNVVITQA